MANLKYIIIPASKLNDIKFNEVAESKDTLRYKVDESAFIVKVSGAIPVDLESYDTYTHNEIINIINNPANGWIENK